MNLLVETEGVYASPREVGQLLQVSCLQCGLVHLQHGRRAACCFWRSRAPAGGARSAKPAKRQASRFALLAPRARPGPPTPSPALPSRLPR